MFNKTYRSILSLTLLTAGLLLGNASYAALAFPGPLNAHFTNPDIIGTALSLAYNYRGDQTPALNNLLTIDETTGTSTGTFKDSGGGSHTITGLNYALSAVLDNASNNQLLSGTLTIQGGINDASFSIANGSTLLVANLTALGTNYISGLPSSGQGTNSGIFQFLGNVIPNGTKKLL